ncbi:low affinity iron permease family protein [Streptomyces sp. NPDC001928]|uniref:low affinity iron permease family protein n=1 Tax=Streptomyces sp. NPDC001928 TaxID=3154404 RepID=UPI00332BFE56
MAVRHPVERSGGRFNRLSEAAAHFTSSPPFYAICLALVAFFIAVHVAGLGEHWQFLAGDMMTAVTLLLLALLKNSEQRAEHAIQKKLDAIAAALLEEREGKTGKATEELRKTIGMDEEV